MSEPIEYTEDEKSELGSLRAEVFHHRDELGNYHSMLTSVETPLKVIKSKIESHEHGLRIARCRIQHFPNDIRGRRKVDSAPND